MTHPGKSAPDLASGDLTIAARHNPALLDAYVAVEDAIGHTFTAKLSLRVLRDEARCAGGAA